MAKLFIIRGVPGSGKSTYAKTLGIPYFEADMYFMTPKGYNFDRNKISDAHKWCQQQVYKELKQGHDVAVSNTFTKLWELKPYLDMALEFDAEVTVIRMTERFNNIHGVPEEVIQKMLKDYEPYK